jgi:carbamoyl-phosphate synthase large subunit
MAAKVLIAGIAGASLGTELLKCLNAAGRYVAYGCDISPYAYGHYSGFEKTFVIDRANYVDSIADICSRHEIRFVLPGADEPNVLLAEASPRLSQAGIHVASNSPELVRVYSDKAATFTALSALGFRIPRTVVAADRSSVESMTFPCIVKPGAGTGGSSLVFLVADADEGMLCVQYVRQAGKTALLQEYLPENEGEFTVGVLSYADGRVAASIALKRLLENKLSVLHKGKIGVISSGYSQGLIDSFPEVCAHAEAIATAIGSKGPLNIQGRMRDGAFVPFEINPRFSASTYLRAMAGINEVDIYLQNVITGETQAASRIKAGYYLRSLAEKFVSPQDIIQR